MLTSIRIYTILSTKQMIELDTPLTTQKENLHVN